MPNTLIASDHDETSDQSIKESSRIPDSYISVTICRNCGEVPIYADVPDRVDAFPWCICRQTPPFVDRISS